MTKGKVVLVPFPFDDLSAAKVRPAVCLTDPVGPHRNVILAFITSRIPADLTALIALIQCCHSPQRFSGARGHGGLQWQGR